MPLRLTTKFTLVSALLVLGVAVAISIAYIAQISRLTIRRTELDDIVAADQVLLQAQHAVTESATSGNAPASGSSEDLRDYLQRGLEDSQGLSSEWTQCSPTIPPSMKSASPTATAARLC